jgi:hypothetical protein
MRLERRNYWAESSLDGECASIPFGLACLRDNLLHRRVCYGPDDVRRLGPQPAACLSRRWRDPLGSMAHDWIDMVCRYLRDSMRHRAHRIPFFFLSPKSVVLSHKPSNQSEVLIQPRHLGAERCADLSPYDYPNRRERRLQERYR